MGAGAVADGVPGGAAPTAAAPGVDYEGEYRVDWTNKLGDGRRAPDDPLRRSATPRSSWSSTARRGAIEQVVAAHDVGRAVNPLLCEGQIEGSVHMGLGYALTEDFPADADGRPDEHDAAQPRHHPRQGRAADRRDPRRGRRSRTRRTASRASARSASCPPPARSPPRCTTSTAPGAPRCRCATPAAASA